MCTEGAGVHEAGESGDTDILGIYYIATIELRVVGIRHLGVSTQHHIGNRPKVYQLTNCSD